MCLIVLSDPQPGFHPRYRGTARFRPCHWDQFSDDSEANELFFWYTDVSDEAGVVRDRALVGRLVHLANVYNVLDPARPHEVVEVVPAGRTPVIAPSTARLGIDLSLNLGFSMLNGWGTAAWEQRLAKSVEPSCVLGWLIYRHFRTDLNRNWLFDDLGRAQECLKAMESLQTLAPGGYEYGDFQPIEVYLLSER
jgi:hypothetical protein